MTGAGRALGAGVRVWVPVVLAVAVVQTLLVLGDPVPLATPAIVALAVASGAAFTIGLWLVSRALSLAVTGAPVSWRAILMPHPALSWSVVVVVLLVMLALLSPYLTVLGLWFGLLVIPPAAAGASNPFPAARHTIRRTPVRVLLGALLVVVVWALCAVGMLLLGFFVTGPLSVILTWLFVSVVATALLAAWTVLYQRSQTTSQP